MTCSRAALSRRSLCAWLSVRSDSWTLRTFMVWHFLPHLGEHTRRRIQQPTSNQHRCSDVFLIPYWSGDVISVAFAIDATIDPRPVELAHDLAVSARCLRSPGSAGSCT